VGNCNRKREKIFQRSFLFLAKLLPPAALKPLFRHHVWLRMLAGLWLAATPMFRAVAHDVGLSTAQVSLATNRLRAELGFAVKDIEEVVELDSDRDGVISPAEFALMRDEVRRFLAASCGLQFDNQPVSSTATECSLDASNNISLVLDYPLREFRQLDMQFDMIRDLKPGHRMFFSLLDAAGRPLAERLLSQGSPFVTIVLDANEGAPRASSLPSFAGFVRLGVEHIGMGYDHLLFLFGLLIVTRSFRSSLVIITAFTLAHSLTLAAATFNLVNLPSRITEPLIAATIVYVGVENILRHGDPHGRWLLTFGFGLVHGFGFASVLREMGVGARAGGVAMPLLGFNLGVEMGQIVVAAVVLPFIWKLREKPLFVRRAVPACSVAVALLGSYWLVQRLWLR
jgi:hypothetical protein